MTTHRATLTADMHAILVATAHTTATRQSRLIPGLRVFLWEFQNRACFDCKAPIIDPLAPGNDLCHIIGECNGRGYVPGNIALGCRECNSEHTGYGRFIPFVEIERLDMIIAAEWPTARDLMELGDDFKATRSAREVSRASRRDFDAV